MQNGSDLYALTDMALNWRLWLEGRLL